MRQHEKLEPHLVEWLPVRLNVEQALQDRIHQDAGNSSARASFMQAAAQPTMHTADPRTEDHSE